MRAIGPPLDAGASGAEPRKHDALVSVVRSGWSTRPVWGVVKPTLRGTLLALLSVLPRTWLREPWAVRVDLRDFTNSTLRANALVQRVNAGGSRRAFLSRLAAIFSNATRARDRSTMWRDAWNAHLSWLEALELEIAAREPGDHAAEVNERGRLLGVAIVAAARETRRLDPFGVSIEVPGVGVVEDFEGRPVASQ